MVETSTEIVISSFGVWSSPLFSSRSEDICCLFISTAKISKASEF